MSLIPDDEPRCRGIELKASDLPAMYCRDCLRYRQTVYDSDHRLYPFVAVDVTGEPHDCFRCKHRLEA